MKRPKYYFDCSKTPSNYCSYNAKHKPETMKEYTAISERGKERLILVCDWHFFNHLSFGWRGGMVLALNVCHGCNHTTCQELIQ
jgi:hypothetical protein